MVRRNGGRDYEVKKASFALIQRGIGRIVEIRVFFKLFGYWNNSRQKESKHCTEKKTLMNPRGSKLRWLAFDWLSKLKRK